MVIELKRFDIQEHIKTPERQAGYLEAQLEDGSIDDIIAAIGDIARARGTTEFARASGISRETIYKQFRPGGNPRLNTIVKAMSALGIKLRISATWEQEQAKSA